ncbi:MAG: hypothetical protein HYX99_03615 [Chloroflexi bacterium]|nr:hypothetical protein [Chloroflexota bacterium]
MKERNVNTAAVIMVGTMGPAIALLLPLLLLVGFGLTIVALLGVTVVLIVLAVGVFLVPALSRPQRGVWVSAFSPAPVAARIAAYQGSCPLGICQEGREFLFTGEGSDKPCPAAARALTPMVQRCRQGEPPQETTLFSSRVCQVAFQVYPAPQAQPVAA